MLSRIDLMLAATWLFSLSSVATAAQPTQPPFPGVRRFPIEADSGRLLTMYLYNARDAYSVFWQGDGCTSKPCIVKPSKNEVWTGSDGKRRIILVLGAEIPNASHSEAARLGIAILRHEDRGWIIEAGSPAVDVVGTFGQLPPVDLINLGFLGHGVSIRDSEMHQGVMDETYNLYAEVGGQVTKVLSFPSTFDRTGFCDENDKLCLAENFQSDVHVEVSGSTILVRQKIQYAASSGKLPSSRTWTISSFGKAVEIPSASP